jgi:hypothetical protein
MNYTFGSARHRGTSLDQFNLNNDYAVGNNRTHLQCRLLLQLRRPRAQPRRGGFVNGWQVSGIVQFRAA